MSAAAQLAPVELALDFPRPRCPFLPVAVEHTCKWIHEVGAVRDDAHVLQLRRDGIVDAGPLLVPSASRSQACLVSDWTLFLILLDDEFDGLEAASNPALAERMIAPVLRAYGGDLAGLASCTERLQGLARAAHDLGRRLALIPSTRAWQARLTRHVVAHISSKLVEARQRASGETPGLAAYLRLRHVTGAAHAYADLVEMTEQVAIPSQVRASRPWRRLYGACADVFVGIQDVCSFAKELATGDSLNLVAVLQHADKCELPSAVELANQWLAVRAGAFANAKTEVASMVRDEATRRHVVRYADALELMLGGALEWNTGSNPRYTRVPQADER